MIGRIRTVFAFCVWMFFCSVYALAQSPSSSEATSDNSETIKTQNDSQSDSASQQSNKTASQNKSLLVDRFDESSGTSKKIASTPVGSGAKTVTTRKETVSPPAATDLRKVERKTLTTNPAPQAGEEFLLKYKFQTGQSILSEVTHLAKTDTKVDTVQQNSHSRTVSQKSWNVIQTENGEMTFEYKINEIDMSQRIGTETELRFNSKSGEPPARQFQNVADSIGKIISTVTIDEQGMIVARSDDINPPNLGMGDITLPVPASPVSVGSTWEIPRDLRIRREDGSLKTVRFRELFRVEKVSAGVATISVRSEMLTAITEPKEEAQVLQQLSNGVIRFDIDAGRMIAKELAWDKTVVGFSGDGSVMDYSARMDEQVVGVEPSTTKVNAATNSKTINPR